MAVKGYYLFRGDKTRCGGVITEGWTDHQHFDRDMPAKGIKSLVVSILGFIVSVVVWMTTFTVKGLPERCIVIVRAPANPNSSIQIGMMIMSSPVSLL